MQKTWTALKSNMKPLLWIKWNRTWQVTIQKTKTIFANLPSKRFNNQTNFQTAENARFHEQAQKFADGRNDKLIELENQLTAQERNEFFGKEAPQLKKAAEFLDVSFSRIEFQKH